MIYILFTTYIALNMQRVPIVTQEKLNPSHAIVIGDSIFMLNHIDSYIWKINMSGDVCKKSKGIGSEDDRPIYLFRTQEGHLGVGYKDKVGIYTTGLVLLKELRPPFGRVVDYIEARSLMLIVEWDMNFWCCYYDFLHGRIVKKFMPSSSKTRKSKGLNPNVPVVYIPDSSEYAFSDPMEFQCVFFNHRGEELHHFMIQSPELHEWDEVRPPGDNVYQWLDSFDHYLLSGCFGFDEFFCLTWYRAHQPNRFFVRMYHQSGKLVFEDAFQDKYPIGYSNHKLIFFERLVRQFIPQSKHGINLDKSPLLNEVNLGFVRVKFSGE